jgi:hypothetical protein
MKRFPAGHLALGRTPSHAVKAAKAMFIEAIDCPFKPFVTIVRNEQMVSLVNMDQVMHDIQANETSGKRRLVVKRAESIPRRTRWPGAPCQSFSRHHCASFLDPATPWVKRFYFLHTP